MDLTIACRFLYVLLYYSFLTLFHLTFSLSLLLMSQVNYDERGNWNSGVLCFLYDSKSAEETPTRCSLPLFSFFSLLMHDSRSFPPAAAAGDEILNERREEKRKKNRRKTSSTAMIIMKDFLSLVFVLPLRSFLIAGLAACRLFLRIAVEGQIVVAAAGCPPCECEV